MAERVRFRIGHTCSCVARSLPVVEQYAIWQGVITESIDLFQLGYRTSVEASAGTHGRGGCVDAGNISSRMTDIWRLFGWTMQPRYLRNPDRSEIVPHYHGWPYRCPHLSRAASLQEQDWDRRDAGLVGTERVVGRYPIDPWDVALRRMEKNMAKTLEQMKREIIAELLPAIQDVPGRVWAADVVPNVWTGNPANENVAASNALTFIGKDVNDTQVRLSTQGKQLGAVTNALGVNPEGKK